MPDEITFVVPGDPRGKGSVRVAVRGKFAHAFPDKKTASFEGLVAYAAKSAMGDQAPMDGPVCIDIVIHLAIPVSTPKKRRAEMEAGFVRPTKKPDCSNVLKSIEDGCNRIVFGDDAQVVQGSFKKLYSDRPRVAVRIRRWTP